MSTDTLVLKFDPNTIQHLGISLYSQLPSVLSELISNSWDADANNITLEFLDANDIKEIVYKDDGTGMSFDELNQKYLLIGRNRRKNEPETTPKGRKVIGKKGLGKLSIFGICDELQVRTVKDGILNEFVMNLSDIKSQKDSSYSPSIIRHQESTEECPGTRLTLKKIRRKTPFDCNDIAKSLSKKFLIFDKIITKLVHNGTEVIEVTNELKFDSFKEQFSWNFPLTSLSASY